LFLSARGLGETGLGERTTGLGEPLRLGCVKGGNTWSQSESFHHALLSLAQDIDIYYRISSGQGSRKGASSPEPGTVDS
jgi:hypothetical protein